MYPSKKSNTENNIFLESRTGSFTYEDLNDYTNRLKTWLNEHWSYFHKPRIALEANSSDDLFMTIAACWNLGISFASLDVAFISRNKINRMDPEVFFGRTQAALDKFDSVHIPALTYDSIKSCLPENLTTLPSISSEDFFAYLFTSGSSGRSKLVPCKRKQIEHSAANSSQLLRPGSQGLWLHCLPLNHIGGVSIIPRSLLYNTGIYRADGFDAEEIATLISENSRIQVVSLVPTMLMRLLDLNAFKPNPNLKAILLGGGPVSPEILKEAYKRDFPVLTSYGMTETCGMIAVEKYEPANGFASGKLLGGNKIKIVTEDFKPATSDETGLIVLKGPQVFEGYDDENDNLKAFDDEQWFHTGDFGSLDASRRLTIETRRTDMIITGGENVSPYEVEAVINRLPGVLESAVAGIPDKEWGQKITALIIFETKELENIPQITSSLKQLLPAYKVPKVIHAVQALPKTSLGKLQRKKISAMVTKLDQ